MIVVDSSVWIAQLRGERTLVTDRLRHFAAEHEILVGDLILMEVLQGARDERHADRIERNLRQFAIVPMMGEAVAIEAARSDRRLRARGITIRKSADLIIATFCVLGEHRLLHDDRDFDLMAPELGLLVA